MNPPSPRTLLRRLAALLCMLVFAGSAWAAPAAKKNPAWGELSTEQQQVLKPLAADWDSLDATQKAKWIGLAKRYPAMLPAEQKRLQTRMDAWARLTPEQRRAARENYRKIGKLPPEKREAVTQEWREYQQLPEHVKQNLAAEQKKNPAKTQTRAEVRKRTKTAKQAPPASTPAPAPVIEEVQVAPAAGEPPTASAALPASPPAAD